MDCAVHLVRLSSSGGANWPGIPDACINPKMLISERAFSCKGQNVLPKAARRRRLGACRLPQQAAGRRAWPGLVEGAGQRGQASGSPLRGRVPLALIQRLSEAGKAVSSFVTFPVTFTSLDRI